MKTYRFKTRLLLPVPRARLFEFFAEPGNLERITPPWLRFEMITSPTAAIKSGTLLDYRLRLRGIPMRWQSEITVWEPPSRFIDRQTRGPYSLWVHEHTFTERDGVTVVGDNVEYGVPGGKIVQKFLVAPELERIFKYRHKILEALFNPKGKVEGAGSLTEDPS
jgi:ligand-binding SRPBCC domain-containing protein